jgi:hypothetical protein
MRTIIFIAILILVFCSTAFSQKKLPVEFRVEKQAMSTPMTALDEVLFTNYYFSKPINIKFDGSLLNMYFDNGATFVKKNVTEVKRNSEFEDNRLATETILYTDIKNASDTISLVVDHTVGYVQIILPTKNSKGEYVGYTSYCKFAKDNELALN